jgi:hypothetical protein
MRRSRNHSYSITSSARASSVGGTSMPSAFAVLRLITNLIGAWTESARQIGLPVIGVSFRASWRS